MSAQPSPHPDCAVIVCRDGALPHGAHDAFAVADRHAVVVGSGALAASHALTGPGSVSALDLPVDLPQMAAALVQLEQLISARMVVLAASPDGRDLAPIVAALMRRPLITGATRVRHHDGVTQVVAVRSDGLVDHVHRVTVPAVVTLLPSAGTGHPNHAGEAVRVTELAATAAPDTTRRRSVRSVEVLPPDPATIDLSEASCIVAGGQGLVSGAPHTGLERFELLRTVGARIGASLGGTRVASDAGWIPFERQIGTTGVEVSPRVYVAFGISGATQHTSGLGTPDHIISVNTDPSCPMMSMADVAIVADAHAVVEALSQRLADSGHMGARA